MTVSIHVECLGDTRFTLAGNDTGGVYYFLDSLYAQLRDNNCVALANHDHVSVTLIPREQIRYIRIEEEDREGKTGLP